MAADGSSLTVLFSFNASRVSIEEAHILHALLLKAVRSSVVSFFFFGKGKIKSNEDENTHTNKHYRIRRNKRTNNTIRAGKYRDLAVTTTRPLSFFLSFFLLWPKRSHSTNPPHPALKNLKCPHPPPSLLSISPPRAMWTMTASTYTQPHERSTNFWEFGHFR